MEKKISWKRMLQGRCARLRGYFWLIFGLAAVGYYLTAGMTAGFAVSALWVWFAAGMVIFLCGIADLAEQRFSCRIARTVLCVLRWCVIFCAVVFFSVQGLVVSRMQADCPDGLDYLIVPGAMVYGEEASTALRLRVEMAEEYLSRNPGTVAVLCGGQGKGELITEAECMRRLLEAAGIPPERMLLEDRSTTTAENMRFAYAIVDDPDASVGVVTSNFHLWRSVHLAQNCGWQNVSGRAAPFSGIMLPHYMAREFLTITVDWLRGNL